MIIIYRCWLRGVGVWTFQVYVMRVLIWSPSFIVHHELSMVLIWIRFPTLPIQFFAKGPLFAITLLIGEPLRMDASIENLAQPSVPRVCVELDVLRPKLERIWINNGDKGF